LIAEDDAILAFGMVDLLRKAGAEVLGPARRAGFCGIGCAPSKGCHHKLLD
jgi:hypothetical protein